MQKINVELSVRQAEELLDQLSASKKIQLVRRWEQETWPERFRQLLTRTEQRLRGNPRLAQEARKVIDPTRRAFYVRRRRH